MDVRRVVWVEGRHSAGDGGNGGDGERGGGGGE